MLTYLSVKKILLKDFGKHAEAMSRMLKQASLAVVLAAARPVHYLESSRLRKELIAKKIMQRDQIDRGPICTLTCVEPCVSVQIYKNRETKRLELRPRMRKCLHLYHTFIHPVFGFMHARIQTWFPFSIQICLNGREWLARQMDQMGLGYVRKENTFVALDDVDQAQQLMHAQVKMNWPALLGPIASRLNPAHSDMFGDFFAPYYWSVHQSAWATDVMFKNPKALAAIYPHLVQHGIRTFGSKDVMRFLGHRIPGHGHVHRRFQGEVITDLRDRPEGMRIKHRVGANSVKLYDKQGSVLRAECTLHDTRPFLVYRKPENRPDARPSWQKLRKGVADVGRRAEVSHKATFRLLEAHAAVDAEQPLGKLTSPLCQPTQLGGVPEFLPS